MADSEAFRQQQQIDYSGLFGNTHGTISAATSAPSIDNISQQNWFSKWLPSRQTLQLGGFLACGLALIGATTYAITTRIVSRRRRSQAALQFEESDDEGLSNDEDDQELEFRFASKHHLRRKKYLASHRAPPLITYDELYEQASMLDQKRRSQVSSKIYFDANDEFVREEQVPEILVTTRYPTNQEDMSSDELDEQQRILDTIACKYRVVEVYLGNEDHVMMGTTRITRNIFAGTQDRNQNARVFLDNVSKIKQSKNQFKLNKDAFMYRSLDRDGLMSQASQPTFIEGEQASLMSADQPNGYNSDSGFESLDPVYEERESVIDDDEVLLNLSPNKFEKPKDQLYMDFFCKYTELFVKEKQGPASKHLKLSGKKQLHESINQSNTTSKMYHPRTTQRQPDQRQIY